MRCRLVENFNRRNFRRRRNVSRRIRTAGHYGAEVKAVLSFHRDTSSLTLQGEQKKGPEPKFRAAVARRADLVGLVPEWTLTSDNHFRRPVTSEASNAAFAFASLPSPPRIMHEDWPVNK